MKVINHFLIYYLSNLINKRTSIYFATLMLLSSTKIIVSSANVVLTALSLVGVFRMYKKYKTGLKNTTLWHSDFLFEYSSPNLPLNYLNELLIPKQIKNLIVENECGLKFLLAWKQTTY